LPIDLELEDINYSRKIPMDLGDSAENFYNISRDITNEFLCKVMRETADPNNDLSESKEVKSKFEDNKENEEDLNEEDLPLPTLDLKNRSNNEFDRLDLKKEQSENCGQNNQNHKE